MITFYNKIKFTLKRKNDAPSNENIKVLNKGFFLA